MRASPTFKWQTFPASRPLFTKDLSGFNQVNLHPEVILPSPSPTLSRLAFSDVNCFISISKELYAMFYTPALVWNMGENVSHQEIGW